jgi:hypothetical protein
MLRWHGFGTQSPGKRQSSGPYNKRQERGESEDKETMRFIPCIAPLIAVGLSLAAVECPLAAAADYYVASNGDDNDSGMTRETAWRSLNKVGQTVLAPGDRIFLEGGVTFHGPLILTPNRAGQGGPPIAITSYGLDRAVIAAGTGGGVLVSDRGGVTIARITIVGSGWPTNTSSGILFSSTFDEKRTLTDVEIDDVEVSGFGEHGILFSATAGGVYRNVRVVRSNLHHNGRAGLTLYGVRRDAYRHVYIGEVEAFDNEGVPGLLPHSGSGIVLGSVSDGVIERCRAFENGRLGNGGVGIWAYESTRLVIQYNESFRNRTDGSADGGGFDLDGGVTHSTLRFNYSHDNDGAGYGLYQYRGASQWSDNTVQYNMSRDDGRKNGYGGIQVWNAGHHMRAARIEHNLIRMSQAEEATPSAVRFLTPVDSFLVNDNIFITSGVPAVIGPNEDIGARFIRNIYEAERGTFQGIAGGRTYDNPDEWEASTQ